MIYRKLAERARKHKYIYTHTHTYIKRVALSPYFVILKLEALVYPNAYGKEPNTRQQKPASPARFSCCFCRRLCWRCLLLLLACGKSIVRRQRCRCCWQCASAICTMCVCVCRCARSMYACVYVCAEEKKKQLKKSICKFSTYDSFLLSMPPPLMLFLLLIFLLSPRVSLIRLANYYYQ